LCLRHRGGWTTGEERVRPARGSYSGGAGEREGSYSGGTREGEASGGAGERERQHVGC
jgi:hypothetical protein